MFEKYAIALGHNPESVAFPAIVEKLKDMASYIHGRIHDDKVDKNGERDSMYGKLELDPIPNGIN